MMKPKLTSAELNALAARVHDANIKWWQDIRTGQPLKRNKFELLALAMSEVSECLEGERKNLKDDKLPKRLMAEVEMADAYIRLLDFAAGFNIHICIFEPHFSTIADNKGEALFHLSGIIHSIGYMPADEDFWVYQSLIYIRSYCEKWGYDLDGAMEEKMAFNAVREDHKHEARRIAGGKQF